MNRITSIKRLKKTLLSKKERLDSLEVDSRNLYVLGAGNTAALYQRCFFMENINPIAYLDNDKKKQGTKFFDKDVFSVESIKGDNKALVLICSANLSCYNSMQKQLQLYGMEYLGIDEFVFAKRHEELIKCANTFEDEFSVELYSEIIHNRINNSIPDAKYFTNRAYFCLPQFSIFDKNESFVDIGAFVGDTLEEYINSHGGIFGKYYAFEPSTINYNALNHRVNRICLEWGLSPSKFVLLNAAVGRNTGEMRLQCDETHMGNYLVNNSDDGSENVKVYSIDDYFSDLTVNFLKADVESFELDMLKGSECVIRRDHPKIAITIEHNATDMYEIILWLKKLDMGYRFMLRHHTPPLFDTVLYAY